MNSLENYIFSQDKLRSLKQSLFFENKNYDDIFDVVLSQLHNDDKSLYDFLYKNNELYSIKYNKKSIFKKSEDPLKTYLEIYGGRGVTFDLRSGVNNKEVFKQTKTSYIYGDLGRQNENFIHNIKQILHQVLQGDKFTIDEPKLNPDIDSKYISIKVNWKDKEFYCVDTQLQVGNTEGVSSAKVSKRANIISVLSSLPEVNKYLRDEWSNDCPEQHDSFTVFVLKRNTSQYDILNICLSKIAYNDAIKILKDSGIKVSEKSYKEGTCEYKDLKFNYRLTGQSYNSKPGPGRRGTTENNAGNSFEKQTEKEPGNLIQLLKNIIGDSEDKLKIINSVDPNKDVKCVGTQDTKTGVKINDEFFKTADNFVSYKNQKESFGLSIADIMVGSLPVSLKYHEKKNSITSLGNFGFGKSSSENKYDKVYTFMKNLIKDKDILENIVLPALKAFYEQDFNKNSWEEYKKENKSSNKVIEIDKSKLNENNITNLLKYAWRGGYYYVVGEKENSNDVLWGFYVNSPSIDALTKNITKAVLGLPYTTKEIYLKVTLHNSLTYKISARDRFGGFDLRTPEVISPPELTSAKAKELNLTGYSKIVFNKNEAS